VDFTPSEGVAVQEALEPELKAEAEKKFKEHLPKKGQKGFQYARESLGYKKP